MRDKLIEYLALTLTVLVYTIVVYFIVNILFKPISYLDAYILSICIRFIEWKFK